MRNSETERVIRVTFNKCTFVKIEVFVDDDNDAFFMFDFTLDGGLNIKTKTSHIWARSIAEQVKFLTDMDEFRKRFIQDKGSVIPELKAYLEVEFDCNDGSTAIEYYEET